MIIREAKETDLPTIIDIYNAAVPTRKATADLKPISLESRREWFKKHDLIFAHNQASIRLFEKFGFQRWGYLPQIAALDDFLADVVILGKKVA